MAKSAIFYSDKYKEIEKDIADLLNSQPDYLSARTAGSTRAVGDAVQAILSEQFQKILGPLCAEYSAEFARRAMADLAFTDCDNFYYFVDVKTHRLGTKFNMPNLTSAQRLARFYEDNRNYFIVLMVEYDLDKTKVSVSNVHFVPIEFLSWECLTVGALGVGQIQIANANMIQINEGFSRKTWMLELCDTMLDFYPREIVKITKRTAYFTALRDLWSQKPDD